MVHYAAAEKRMPRQKNVYLGGVFWQRNVYLGGVFQQRDVYCGGVFRQRDVHCGGVPRQRDECSLYYVELVDRPSSSRERITSVRPVVCSVVLLKYQLQFALVVVMFSQ